MLAGRDIICIASSSWNAMWVNSQHLMDRLANDNRVLYINNLGLRAPGKSSGDWRKVFRRVGEWFRGAVRVKENIWIISPISIPLHGYSWIRRFNRWILKWTIRRYLRRLDFRDPLLWSFLPLGVELIDKLGESLVIYHCVDDYAANPGVAAEELREMESRLLVRADLVFATNPVLYEERTKSARKIFYLGNVANAGHFFPQKEREIPPRLAKLPKPILGYQGNISGYKTDLSLVAHLARSLPHASIVLVGPVGWGDPATDVSQLKELGNTHLLGRVPYEDLPDFVAAFDVGLLPMKNNESTRRSFPMKFYEYMAAGKPIVATSLPAFEQYRDRPHLCRLAEDKESFVKAVEDALSETEDFTTERVDEAKANSWRKRVEQIGEIVAEELNDKKEMQ